MMQKQLSFSKVFIWFDLVYGHFWISFTYTRIFKSPLNIWKG
jgi:hypothetical protein